MEKARNICNCANMYFKVTFSLTLSLRKLFCRIYGHFITSALFDVYCLWLKGTPPLSDASAQDNGGRLDTCN